MHLTIGALLCVVSVMEVACQGSLSAEGGARVKYLEAGETFDFHPTKRHRGFFEKDLRTYCYRGEKKTLQRLFESVEFYLDIEGDDYTQYDGKTADEVRQHYEERRSLFSFNLFTHKSTHLQLSPFAQTCIGIETIEPYTVRLHRVRVDFWRVIQLGIGCLVFCYAGTLSQNAVFYYITGVALGICSSFMLLIWLTSKLVPRRTMMYGVLIGGWTIGVYIIQLLWENLQVIVMTYRSYVFWYVLVTGVISFLFCYRWGPPTNKRSKDIVKWLLQLMSLALIYFSSHYEEATAAIIIITILLYYFPRRVFYKVRGLWLRRFPPKRRLLTNEEYYEQGVRETTKALNELRSYASSPECNQWRMMCKLRDPLRFAAFVEGASHLRDEEILRFEGSKYDDSLIDDSDSSANEDEEEVTYMKSNGSYREQQAALNSDEISEDEDDDIRDEIHRSRYTAKNSNSRHYAVNDASSSSIQRARPPITATEQVRSPNVPRLRLAHRQSTPRESSAQRGVGNTWDSSDGNDDC